MEVLQLLDDAMYSWVSYVAVITPEPEPEASTSTFNWVPLFTAFLGALAGISGVVVGQIISARNEARRLMLQHEREDKLRRREELRTSFADFLRELNSLSIAHTIVVTTKDELDSVPSDSPEEPVLSAKYEVDVRKYGDHISRTESSLAVIELLGVEEVSDLGQACIDWLTRNTTTRERWEALRKVLVLSMRVMIDGTPEDKEYLRPNINELIHEPHEPSNGAESGEQPSTADSTPQHSGEAGTEKSSEPTKR